MYKVVKFADSDKHDWQLGTNSLNFKAGDLPISGLILDFGLGNEDYTSEYSYDANGNITGAYRQGRAYGSDSDRSFDTIDDYMVKYKGNQKQSIEGGLNTDAVYYGSSAFVDGADKDVEYAYSANGSMMMDLNKGITDISYDNTGNLKKTSTRARSSTALSVSTGTTYTPGNITQ